MSDVTTNLEAAGTLLYMARGSLCNSRGLELIDVLAGLPADQFQQFPGTQRLDCDLCSSLKIVPAASSSLSECSSAELPAMSNDLSPNLQVCCTLLLLNSNTTTAAAGAHM